MYLLQSSFCVKQKQIMRIYLFLMTICLLANSEANTIQKLKRWIEFKLKEPVVKNCGSELNEVNSNEELLVKHVKCDVKSAIQRFVSV